MKKLIAIAALVIAVTACNTTQQRITYNTLGSLETLATAAVDNYDKAAIQGLAPRDKVPLVGAAYNRFQASMVLAVDVAHNDTNAAADINITRDLNDFFAVVNSFYPPHYTKTNQLLKVP